MSEQVQAPEVLFQLAGVGVVETDMQTGRFRRANAAFCEMVGYSERELRRMTYLQLTHPDDRARDAERFAALGRGEHRAGASLTRVLPKGGGVVWLELYVTLVGEGDEAVNLTVVNDVTGRKQAEEASSELTARSERQTRIFETVLSTIDDFVYIFGRDGRFTYSNQSLLDLLGITSEEIIGKNFFDLGYPEDLAARLESQIQQVLGTGEAVKDETPFTSPTGQDGFYEYIFKPVLGADGSVEAVAGSTRDITERKRAEAALRESEAGIAADLAGMRRLYELQSKLADQNDVKAALQDVLAVACDVTGTERGCVQLLSADGERLEMAVWQGYAESSPFISFFRYEGLAVGCEVARVQRQRLIIEDTIGFAGLEGTDAAVAVRADEIRASQSTPVTGRAGETIGVISTQFRQPHRPTDHELRLLDMLAWTAGEFLERHRANAAQHKADARLQKALSAETVGVLFFSLDGGVQDANETFVRMSGYTRDELQSTVHWETLTPPEFTEGTARAAAELAETGETAPYEKQLFRKDGSRWWGLFAPTRLSGSGLESQCVEFIIDITTRKQAEETLRVSEEQLRSREERYRIALEAAELATWDWHVVADRIIWNEQHYRLFGLEPAPADETASSFLRFVHPEDLEGVKGALEQATREGILRAEFRIVRADDRRVRWMNSYGRVVERQGERATRMTGVMFDTTERKGAEKALRALNETLEQRVRERTVALQASERRFSQAFYVNPVPACMTTLECDTLAEVNDAFLELTGYTRDEVVGKSSRELGMWSSPEDQKKLSDALREDRGFRNLELKLRSKEGLTKTILMSAEVIELGGDKGYLKMFYDLTARKQTEEQLHRAIQEVMSDASWFSRSLLEQLSRIRHSGDGEVPVQIDLSRRERQVLERLAGGASNDAIAAELGLSTQTVRNYISNVYDKLGVHSRAEAIVWARERGIVS